MKSVLPFKTRCCQCCHCVIQIHSPLYVLVIAACFWCKVKVDKFCCSRLAPIPLFCICCESESRSVVSDSLLPYGLYSPWNSQARILELVVFVSFRVYSQPRNRTQVSHVAGGFFQLSHKGSPRILEWVADPFSSGFSWPRNRTRSPALQADSLPAEPQGSPIVLEWVAYPFSRESSQPRDWTQVSCIAGRFFTSWATREAQ